nr:MAK10-like protein [Tanacetum cinerariifolium]
MGEANHIRTFGDYSKPRHEGYRNTIELPEGNNVVPLRSDIIRRTIDQSAGGRLRDRNAKKSLALLEDLSLYDNESWNDPKDFAKPVKAISLPQDVPSTSDRCLIEIEHQWSPRHSVLHGKSQASFVEYAFSRTDKARALEVVQTIHVFLKELTDRKTSKSVSLPELILCETKLVGDGVISIVL